MIERGERERKVEGEIQRGRERLKRERELVYNIITQKMWELQGYWRIQKFETS